MFRIQHPRYTTPVEPRGQTIWKPNGRRALLREEAVDAAGRPGGDATAEEVGVLSPDRTAESKGRCENRPVLRIACAEPLPRFGFEVAVEIIARPESRVQPWPSETTSAFAGSPPRLSDQRGQVLLRFCVRGFGKEERNVVRMGFEDTPNPLTEHGSNQNVGIEHQALRCMPTTSASAFSRGWRAGSPCTPA